MKVKAGVFRLVRAQDLPSHEGHEVTCRDYPGLAPPASFFDCWTCGLTWEIGR